MYSMTGIGVSAKKTKHAAVQVTVKSVNGRFLDIKLYQPKEYDFLESDIKKRISNVVRRGTVSVQIERKRETLEAQVEELNVKRIQGIHKKLKTISEQLKIKEPITMDIILKFPDVIQTKAQGEVTNEEKKIVLQCLDDAIQKFNHERNREGIGLIEVLKSLIKELDENANLILKKAHPMEKEVRAKLDEKLKKFGLEGELDPTRVAQEVVMQLEKLDVTEEVERILEHIKEIKKTFQSSELVGKKLEFYTQELFREFNTVGSKTQDAEVTRIVVESKVLVERIREQVQNIE